MYTIIVDGGYKPKGGYGSYVLLNDLEDIEREAQFDLPEATTNNMAEYMALIRALEDLEAILAEPESHRLRIQGDSQLVLKQISGDWKLKRPHLRPLRNRCRELLALFGEVTLEWVGKDFIVEWLGH